MSELEKLLQAGEELDTSKRALIAMLRDAKAELDRQTILLNRILSDDYTFTSNGCPHSGGWDVIEAKYAKGGYK